MRRHALTLLLLLTTVFLAAQASAQIPPERERGFKPDLAYQFSEFDSVNLFNGNLNLSIPIASYPVSATVSYSFVFRYAGNVWDPFEHCNPGPIGGEPECTLRWRQHGGDNAGTGWNLSFGELDPPASTAPDYAGTAASMWKYTSGDGGEHFFYDVLHEPACSPSVQYNCDPVVSGVRYTRDGTYLRLKDAPAGKVLELPDGARHLFTYGTNGWRLEYIYGTDSAPDANGVPTTNYARFEYQPSAVHADVEDWHITDSHGRAHDVYFQPRESLAPGGMIVDRLSLAAFRRPEDGTGPVRAEYNLTYDNVSSTTDGPASIVAKPCGGAVENTAEMRFLRRIDLPSGETWQFTYHQPTTGCDDSSATLIEARFPTLGSLHWLYQKYEFSTSGGETAATGVAERWHTDPSGDWKQYARYIHEPAKTTVETHAPVTSTLWRVDSKTVSYFNGAYGSAFGLPFTPSISDGTPTDRKLSSETFDCDPATNSCSSVPERRKFLKYEMDSVTGCNIDYPCARDRNRRVVSDRTLFVTDGSRYADVNRYSFDGLGHYRQEVTAGNFTSGNVRDSFTSFNESVGYYNINPDGTRAPGFTMLPATAPWVLNTYSGTYVSEGGSIARTQACFDPATGFLLSKRIQRTSAVSPGANDLLAVYTRDPGTGYASREEFFGGDQQTIATGTLLCSLTPPSHSASSFRIDHTYQYGVLKTSRYVDGSTGSPVPFYSTEHSAIDQNTGLVKDTKDVAGLVTTYLYDRSGRLTSVAPPGVEATIYTYNNASGTIPASVHAGTGFGNASVQQLWEFDPFGRLAVEKRLMPDNTWSGRKTTYDFAGRRASVSEQETVTGSPFNPVNKTTFENYDPFGRVGTVRGPDNKTTTFSYIGERLTTRTYEVALTGGDANVSVTEERDRAGRLIQVTEDATGTPAVTDYTYDVGNRLATVTMHDGATNQPRTFSYDQRGFLTSETHPESGTTTYQYDARGHILTRTTPVATLTYEYDRAERVKRVNENGLELKFFTYDRPSSGSDFSLGKAATAMRHNRGTSLGDITVTETFFYAGLGGRLSSKQTTLGTGESFSDSYTYNSLGDLATVGYPSCAGCGAPSRNVTSTYQHGLVNNVNGYTNGISYHPNGAVAAIQHRNTDGSNGPLYTQTIANSMARPESISVSGFCDQANLSISVPPQHRTVTSNSPAGLTVTAPGATSWRWFRVSGSTLFDTGQTGSTLNEIVTATTTYLVRVGNGFCTLDSEQATVTVQACGSPATATVSGSATITQGGSAPIYAALTGTGPWDVTWSDGVTQNDVATSPANRLVSPNSTTTYTVTALTDGNGCAGTSSGSATITVQPLAAPTGVIATATSTSQVQVTWAHSGSADRFDVFRDGVFAGSSTTLSFTNSGLLASKSYVYTVKAVVGTASSPSSNPDLATTILFTDDPLVAGTTAIKAVHITQLQTAVNAVRGAAGWSPLTFSSVSPGTVATATHIQELRNALATARSALGLPAVSYSRNPITAGMTILASDLNQTRGGVK